MVQPQASQPARRAAEKANDCIKAVIIRSQTLNFIINFNIISIMHDLG